MNQQTEQVSALVIGKSGNGKSEFILSLINDSDKNKILASGEGQTTRTSMEYNIDCINKNQLQISVELKSKEDFVTERMIKLKNLLKEDGEIESLKDNDNEYILMAFEDELIHDDAFFNCNELGEEIANNIEHSFRNIFTHSFFSNINIIVNSDNIIELADEEKEQEVNWEKDTKAFFENVYNICIDSINKLYNKNDLNNIADKDAAEIKKFLKTEENEISYSAFVNNIIINTSIADSYCYIFSDLKISKIRLIDTYGLDHAENTSTQVIKNRYINLFNEYNDIRAVFYIRAVNNDSPIDLKYNIPLLFEVEPTVIPYIIFTKIDKLPSNAKLEACKIYKNIEKEKNNISSKLKYKGVSSNLIKNRVNELMKSRCGYCSTIINNPNKEYLLKTNTNSLKTIFSSIKYKNYLGDSFVPINKMSTEALSHVISIEEIFSQNVDIKLHDYPSRTKGAIKYNLLNGTLGFCGSTTESVYWSYVISCDFKYRFYNIMKLYKWKDYLNNYVGDIDSVLTTISEFFLTFSRKLYENGHIYDYSVNRNGNNIIPPSGKIINALYEAKKDLIGTVLYYRTVGEYLDKVYKFSDIPKETKDKIQKIINENFNSVFIKECRQHNARKIAEKISNETTQSEIDTIINDYYKNYDFGMDIDEKIEFEQIIENYIK